MSRLKTRTITIILSATLGSLLVTTPSYGLLITDFLVQSFLILKVKLIKFKLGLNQILNRLGLASKMMLKLRLIMLLVRWELLTRLPVAMT